MAEDAEDVKLPDITPEDFDGDDQETPAKAAPSADSDKKPETAKGDDTPDKPEPPADDGKPAPEDEEKAADDAEKTDDSDADTPEDKQPTKGEERKDQLNTEIRDLVSKRNAIREEVRSANNEAYQPATEEDLVAEGLSDTDAKLEAMRQREEMRDYNEKVSEAQLTIETEAQRVLTDFPMFDPDSSDFNEELRDQAAELMNANLIFDSNTKQVIGSNVSPYKVYQTIATAAGASKTKGEIEGKRAAERQLANADSPSSTPPPSKKPEDALTALWASDD